MARPTIANAVCVPPGSTIACGRKPAHTTSFASLGHMPGRNDHGQRKGDPPPEDAQPIPVTEQTGDPAPRSTTR